MQGQASAENDSDSSLSYSTATGGGCIIPLWQIHLSRCQPNSGHLPTVAGALPLCRRAAVDIVSNDLGNPCRLPVTLVARFWASEDEDAALRDQYRDTGAALFLKQVWKRQAIPADLMVREYPAL